MVWGEMGSEMLDMLVNRGMTLGVRCSAMGLELFLGNIDGDFSWGITGISWTPPHGPLSKVDGTPVL